MGEIHLKTGYHVPRLKTGVYDPIVSPCTRPEREFTSPIDTLCTGLVEYHGTVKSEAQIYNTSIYT